MLDKLRTLAALGPRNVARVGAYRLGLRLGVHPVLKIEAPLPRGPFFRNNAPHRPSVVATDLWLHEAALFSKHRFPLAGPPDWHANPFRAGARAASDVHWSRVPDFDPAVGDIKTVWEASRFDWLVAMAQRASLGDTAELDRLNLWLQSWLEANPPYRGANWKCGQEASIRVMHTAVAALVLGEVHAPTDGLRAFVKLHLARIAPTVSYAIGQQNNHATSEAAALFIGGSWLDALGDSAGASWAHLGRRWLEDRAQALIEPDGTFSQYSVVYHRLMLDTCSLAEVWRRHMVLPAFSGAMYARLRAATHWLRQMTDPTTGDAPNFGANDGARLMPLTATDYRDFRPSLQLAAALFAGARAFDGRGPWEQPLLWLDIAPPADVLPALSSMTLDDGGLHVLRQGAAVLYLRYPRFRFRPSHADALHLDLWLGGRNVLRDDGTYSYAGTDEELRYFAGTAAHSTVQFDGRDQMPRLGRFLFGAWLAAESVTPITREGAGLRASAAYRDVYGARHERAVVLGSDRIVCTDTLSGNARRAVLRWRLGAGDWKVEDGGVTDGSIRIRVTTDTAVRRLALVDGWESRYYLHKAHLPVLEVESEVPARLTTEVRF